MSRTMSRLLIAVTVVVICIGAGGTTAIASNDGPTVTVGDTSNDAPSDVPLPDPQPEPPPAEASHTAYTYTVQEIGYYDADLRKRVKSPEDLASIESKVNLTLDEIKYSNLDKDITKLVSGDILTLSPIHGIVYKIVQGDTISGLAYSYQVDANAIDSYNNIPDPNVISPDQIIIIPGAKLPPIPLPQPVAAVQATAYSAPPTPSAPAIAPGSYSGPNRFTPGNCTWWVFHLRPIPWMGDAGQWWYNARAFGYAEGSTPRIGAIVVERLSSFGHVALVTSVSSDSFTVTEMNYKGLYVVDTRSIRNGASEIVGFIY